MNTVDYLLSTAEHERFALIDAQQAYTYGDLEAAVAALSGALSAQGVQIQDRVALFGPNSFFWAAAYLAILKLGAVAVPFSPVARTTQLSKMQAMVRCRFICGETHHLSAAIRSVFDDCMFITEKDLTPSTEQRSPFLTSAQVAPDQLAALMFTSGTTAHPRAVCITHRNLQANTASIIEALKIDPSDRMMVVLPFYYCFGTSLLHTHLHVGASLMLASNAALPEAVLNEIETHGCTSFAGVPSVYQMLLRSSTFARRALPTLRNFQQAGGKLQPVLIEKLIELRPNARIFIMYGQTEATARLSCLPPELLQSKQGSIGRGLPGVELRVVTTDGQAVRPGEVGQIIARGDNISPGYLDEPEASARSFVDGALHTGDIAKIDDEGFIYIVDRESDFIKSLGHRVSSYEIEACVMTLPDVLAAAAVGISDPLFGEAIRVFVTLRAHSQLEQAAIITHCKRTLPRYMIPKEIIVLDQMPMNDQGKVLKKVLRERA